MKSSKKPSLFDAEQDYQSSAKERARAKTPPPTASGGARTPGEAVPRRQEMEPHHPRPNRPVGTSKAKVDSNTGSGTIKRLPIAAVRIDATQMREKLNLAVVDEYSEVLDDLPPAVVFFDGAEYWLGDGFHRYHATTMAGRTELYCEVRNGTRDDAVWFACRANRAHGLRRSNADKHKAVATALKLHPDYSGGRIAEHVGVSAQMVADTRTNSQNLEVARIGRDEITRRQPKRKPKGTTHAAASPDAEKRTEVAGESDDRGGANDVPQPGERTRLDQALRAIDALLEEPESLIEAQVESLSMLMERLRKLADFCMPRLRLQKRPAPQTEGQPNEDDDADIGDGGHGGADDSGVATNPMVMVTNRTIVKPRSRAVDTKHTE